MPTVHWVAHRGNSAGYPENTALAISTAIHFGAQWIEIDVQMIADENLIIFHDATLDRTTDSTGSIFDKNISDLTGVSAGEPARFGNKYINTPIPLLSKCIELITNTNVTVFLEVKEESIAEHGVEKIANKVLEQLTNFSRQFIIISYESRFLAHIKSQSDFRIGKVVRQWNDNEQTTVTKLNPDFVICNHTKIPQSDDPLWPGTWSWMLYEIVDPAIVKKYLPMGIRYFETMEFEKMTQPDRSSGSAD